MEILLIFAIIGFIFKIMEKDEKGEKREAYYPNGKLLARAYFNKKGESVKQYEAHTSAFYWDIQLLPGMETEKILNVTIKAPQKNPVAKKRKKR